MEGGWRWALTVIAVERVDVPERKHGRACSCSCGLVNEIIYYLHLVMFRFRVIANIFFGILFLLATLLYSNFFQRKM